jgi:DNA polymerase-3 subunit alpha
LFDTFEEENTTVALEAADEWPALELLTHEKQNLGFYFSGHPLDKYRDHIRSYTNLNMGAVEEVAGTALYTVIGILKETREITTKSGRRMAFAQFEQARDLLVGDRVVAVRGRIDRSRGEAKLKVESVIEPEELKHKATRSVHVRFTGEDVSEEDFLRLRDFIVGKPGDCGVFFHIKGDAKNGEIVIKASPHISLSADETVLSEVRGYPLVEDVWRE